VGNNPGIYIIAAGGAMIGLGIPWAFWIKPALVRRKSRKLQQRVATQSPSQPHTAKEHAPTPSTTHA